ncbi:MAG: M60 family metallopeptidase [Planctomycetes bacterium]|nr:M60 family metallopeptidase [Planctomycetota bacterium]
MQTELLGSFAALKQHIKGIVVLNDDQIDVHKEKIKEHRYAFGHNRTIVKAALDLVDTFENVKGALWRDHPEMNKRKAEPRGLNWAIYHVMQYIMDEVYTANNLAKYEDLLDGYKFQCSDYFPGKVEPPANPNKTHTVKVSATQKKAIRDNRMYVQWPARKPTGTYLAPGTIATVTVPEAIVGKNYQVRVGSHSWDNTYKPRVARIGRCTTVFPINSTEVKVANPLGGGIYIEVPYLADAADVIDVTVKNAIRSPYFSAKPFHKTTLEEWRNVERNFKAPWADFQSEKFMMNVPTSWIYKLDDPVTLMKDWDKAMDGMNYLFGFPEVQSKETMYVQVDRQMRASVFAPGYPSVNSTYDPRKDYGGNHNHHFIRGPRNVPAVVFHERCHAYGIMHLLGLKEATVHLPHVAALNLGLGIDIDKAYQTSCVSYANLESRTVDNTAISWMVGIYFAQKKSLVGVKYKHIGHAHFVYVARLFGWKALHNFYYSYNMDHENGIPYGDSVDKFARLCESAGADLRPLFHFWGRFDMWDGNNKASVAAKRLEAHIDAKKLPASAKIYDLLVRYKSMVPKNNKEFQEFTRKWWGRKPRIEGFCHEAGHARQWDSQVLKEPTVWPNGDIYDEKSCARVEACMQEIIDMYFPNGRPKK